MVFTLVGDYCDMQVIIARHVELLQDTWHVMRLRIDHAVREHKIGTPANAHAVIGFALQVPDNIVLG